MIQIYVNIWTSSLLYYFSYVEPFGSWLGVTQNVPFLHVHVIFHVLPYLVISLGGDYVMWNISVR